MRKARIASIFILLALMLSQCDGPKPPIRIGVNAWPPCEIWYIAEKMGYFGDTPVQIVRFSAWADNMQSLYVGKTDLTHATYFNALYYSQKGEKGSIVLVSDTLEGGDGLAVKRAIENGADLRQKRIAVEIGTDEHFLLFKALQQFGLTISDVVLVPSTSSEAKDRFIAGDVDACFTYEPFLSEAAAKGDGKIIKTTLDFPGYMIDVLVGRSEAIKQREKDYRNVIAAWYKAQAYIKQNPEAAFALIAPNENMDEKSFAGFYNSFTFFSLEENRSLLDSPAFTAKLQEIAEFIQSNELEKGNIDFNGVYTKKIVDGL